MKLPEDGFETSESTTLTGDLFEMYIEYDGITNSASLNKLEARVLVAELQTFINKAK